MAGHSHEPPRLRAEADQALLDFIRTDLDVCLTLARLAETKYRLGYREHTAETLARAEKGYSDMLRFFSRARGMTAEVEEELQSKFKRLRERLDGLKRLG
jgi:hypothetical protein